MARVKEDLLWFTPLAATAFFLYELLVKTTSVKDSVFFGNTGAVFLGPLLVSALIVIISRAIEVDSPFTNPVVRKLVYPVSALIFLAGWLGIPPHGKVLPVIVENKQGVTQASTPPTLPPAPEASSPSPVSPGTDTYLSGTLRIGINGCLPGWSDATAYRQERGCAGIAGREFTVAEVAGMDAGLAKFLGEKHGFDITFVAVTQAERKELWCTANDNPRKIDILISVYSITPDRRNCATFTSPYYIDVNEVWHLEKSDKVPTAYGCGVSGTTGLDKLKEMENAGRPFGGEDNLIVEGSSNLAACIEKFNGEDKAIRYVSSDWSILQGYYRGVYGRGQTVTYIGDQGRVTDDSVRPSSEFAAERYAVALPRSQGNACRTLDADISVYLTSDDGHYKNTWTADFTKHVKPALTEASGTDPAEPSWHRPPTGPDPEACT